MRTPYSAWKEHAPDLLLDHNDIPIECIGLLDFKNTVWTEKHIKILRTSILNLPHVYALYHDVNDFLNLENAFSSRNMLTIAKKCSNAGFTDETFFSFFKEHLPTKDLYILFPDHVEIAPMDYVASGLSPENYLTRYIPFVTNAQHCANLHVAFLAYCGSTAKPKMSILGYFFDIIQKYSCTDVNKMLKTPLASGESMLAYMGKHGTYGLYKKHVPKLNYWKVSKFNSVYSKCFVNILNRSHIHRFSENIQNFKDEKKEFLKHWKAAGSPPINSSLEAVGFLDDQELLKEYFVHTRKREVDVQNIRKIIIEQFPVESSVLMSKPDASEEEILLLMSSLSSDVVVDNEYDLVM